MLASLLLLVVMAQMPSLVPGTGNTWTNGVQTWAGNPFCAEAGVLLQSTSSAIDAGELIPGFHCPSAGPGDGTCQEWYGKAPDIGACEFVPSGPPRAPFGLVVGPGGPPTAPLGLKVMLQ